VSPHAVSMRCHDFNSIAARAAQYLACPLNRLASPTRFAGGTCARAMSADGKRRACAGQTPQQDGAAGGRAIQLRRKDSDFKHPPMPEPCRPRSYLGDSVCGHPEKPVRRTGPIAPVFREGYKGEL